MKENHVANDEPKHYLRFDRVYGLRGGPYLMGDEVSIGSVDRAGRIMLM